MGERLCGLLTQRRRTARQRQCIQIMPSCPVGIALEARKLAKVKLIEEILILRQPRCLLQLLAGTREVLLLKLRPTDEVRRCRTSARVGSLRLPGQLVRAQVFVDKAVGCRSATLG